MRRDEREFGGFDARRIAEKMKKRKKEKRKEKEKAGKEGRRKKTIRHADRLSVRMLR